MSDLLKINVNEHTEKKGGLTYLSWAWAWAEVLKVDPDAVWDAAEYMSFENVLRPCMYMPDGSALVKTFVTIKNKTKSCTLPVMDNRNNAVKNPDARKISDAIMRCMTKAIAMHGLGLYIYAGEDLPDGSAPDPTPESAVEATLRESIAAEKEKRFSQLDELALDIIEAYREDRHGEAVKLWFNDASFNDADERGYCWNNLRAEPTLRALLQANSPHRDHTPKPVVERIAPGPGLKKVGRPIEAGNGRT